ncbi:small, acid-soluble spore protein, alpha/beta type [Paenibacillus chartarius]|uniref:Small, acid-soluble spore protein, alpha/beta type n=1 Tax=Paenibacillus chartarius TaxID=747481 RepID=A0ABV6DPD2_9BACL
MARRRSNRPLVPHAGRALDQFKADVMRREGYQAARPEQVKFEVAKSLGIPLDPRYNGQLQTEDAGRIGGQIGGAMVREMVRMAQQKLSGANSASGPQR